MLFITVGQNNMPRRASGASKKATTERARKDAAQKIAKSKASASQASKRRKDADADKDVDEIRPPKRARKAEAGSSAKKAIVLLDEASDDGGSGDEDDGGSGDEDDKAGDDDEAGDEDIDMTVDEDIPDDELIGECMHC